jgi:peptide deformylase
VGEVDDALRRLAADMLATMYAAPGRGLAGPQVGVMKRLFVMDVAWREGDPEPMVFLDPEIVWRSPETRTGIEGCLSIPGVLAEVERAAEIEVTWRDLGGARHPPLRRLRRDLHPARDRPPRRPRHLRPRRARGPRRAGGRLRAGPRVTVRPFVPYPDRRLSTPAAPVPAITDEIRAIWAT